MSLEVVAGDGTKLKANASMAANVTAEQLDAQIAELEELIDAEVRQWVAEHLAWTTGSDGGRAAPGARRGRPGGTARRREREGRSAEAGGADCWRAARPPARSWPPGRRTRSSGSWRPGSRSWPRGWSASRKPPSRRPGEAAAAAAGGLAAQGGRRPPGAKPPGRQPGRPDADRDVIRTRAQAWPRPARPGQAAAAALAPAPRRTRPRR